MLLICRLELIVGQSNNTRIARTAANLIRDDPNGEWKAQDIRLHSFLTILHKSAPPIEFDKVHASLDWTTQGVRDVYDYVFTVYNGTKPLHQLALFCAFIVAGLAPQVYPPKSTEMKNDSLKNHIRKLAWCERRGKTGSSVREPFIVMATVFFIAYLDADSPLHKMFADKLDDLTHWHSKHSAKGLTALLLCRLGLAEPRQPRILKAARWFHDLELLKTHQVKALHADVITMLKGGNEYGGYDAVTFLVGRSAADILAGNGWLIARRYPSTK
ncbi:hypothetical protein HD554DRAFT_2177976 [Boletus coccyginus]|nr:hypothetical protein HD554DRAFT_2177976 [Boletus coccyginus]